MEEKLYQKQFVNFLISQKGYPQYSILSDTPIGSGQGDSRRYIFADLVLLDVDFKNYLAQIEFKESRLLTRFYWRSWKRFHNKAERTNLLLYVVSPKDDSEGDFNIYSFDNNEWRQIEKEDFPTYEALRAKQQADEKSEFKSLNELKQKEVRKKKEIIQGTAWASLLSLIVAIIVSVFLTRDIFFREKNTSNFVSATCCDSIEFNQQKINFQLTFLEKTIDQMRKEDSLIKSNKDKVQLLNLQNRIVTLENLINQSPERLLKIQEIAFQVQQLKTVLEKERELNDIKILNLKERLDQLAIWMGGLIITIIGSITGFAINAFRKS